MGAVTVIKEALQRLIPDLAVSDASIESKIIDVVGTYADTEKLERENTLDVINKALANQKITTVEYYRRKAVEFQQGDNLVYDPVNQGGYYANIDETKRIVKQAYVVEDYPRYNLLVNKLGADGHLTTLTTDELVSFASYYRAFEPLGLTFNILSLPVARITDPNIVVYVRTGADATAVAAQINAKFLANESVLRPTNLVSLTEISDLIQSVPDVVAVGFDKPIATETNLQGVQVTQAPTKGVFKLLNGAFIFGTTITPSMIKTLQ